MEKEAYLETRQTSVLDALSLVHEKALKSAFLSKKTKELIALATSVATGCETSVAYHLHNAMEAGATQDEMLEAVDVAVVTMGEPAAVHAAQILRAMDIDAAERFVEDRSPGGEESIRARAATHPYMTPD